MSRSNATLKRLLQWYLMFLVIAFASPASSDSIFDRIKSDIGKIPQDTKDSIGKTITRPAPSSSIYVVPGKDEGVISIGSSEELCEKYPNYPGCEYLGKPLVLEEIQ
mgnify:CR=1 FL=1